MTLILERPPANSSVYELRRWESTGMAYEVRECTVEHIKGLDECFRVRDDEYNHDRLYFLPKNTPISLELARMEQDVYLTKEEALAEALRRNRKLQADLREKLKLVAKVIKSQTA